MGAVAGEGKELLWRDLDVAVIGGGPAGLSVALALRRVRPDLTLKVFEASPAYTQQGAGVYVATNGAKALEAIDPTLLHRLLEGAAFTTGVFTYSDVTGEQMPWVSGVSPFDSLDKYGITGGMVPWNSIRTVLYGVLPDDTVEFGCKVLGCSALEPLEQDGASQKPQGAASHPNTSPVKAPCLGRGSGSSGGDGSGADGTNGSDDHGGWYTLDVLLSEQESSGDGHQGQPRVREVRARARHVIAADGYFSRVRRTAGGGGAPAFQGNVRWLGNITQAELDSGSVPLPAALDPRRNPFAPTSLHTWMPTSVEQPLRGPPKRGLYLYPAGTDAGGSTRYVWSLYAPVEALEAAGERYPLEPAAGGGGVQAPEAGPGGEAEGGGASGVGASVHQTSRRGGRTLQRALASSPHLPPDVRAMLAATPAERVMEFGMHTHPAESYKQGAWARGRLLLLGDAAHAGRPDGQGANQALEDAAVLGACVREHGLGPQAFAAWEEARLERVRDILTDDSADAARRFTLITTAAFEPLWSPAEMAAPGGPLPDDVRQEVTQATANGDAHRAREAVVAWSRRVVRSIVERQAAGRAVPQTVPPPEGMYRFR